MGNCYIKKLKCTVNNDNIEIFDTIEVNNFGTEKVARSMTEFAGSNLTVKRTSGKMYNASGVEQSEITGDTCKFYFENADTTTAGSILLYGKYEIESIKNVYNFQGDTLASLFALTTFSGTLASRSTDSEKFFKKTNYVDININGTLGFKDFQSIDMAPFRDSATLTAFRSSISDNNGFYMADLGKYLPDCIELIQCHTRGIKGSIEDYVANARINRTSGSLTVKTTGTVCPITFQGSTISTQTDHTLSWTATTITFDGTTIQNSDVAN